jgi:Uma2 family endonuclease
MAETDFHRVQMVDLIETLTDWFAKDEMTYVSGNILLFYEKGNKCRHVSPDVLVVRGIRNSQRDNYLVWEEGKAPDVIIEVTSKTTKREDMEFKRKLYQKTLQVAEYFLFDPRSEYLSPPFHGYVLRRGRYSAIAPVDGRLPSKVIGLHFERVGGQLRLWDPSARRQLPTRAEAVAIAENELRQTRDEMALLRREVDELKRERRTT